MYITYLQHIIYIYTTYIYIYTYNTHVYIHIKYMLYIIDTCYMYKYINEFKYIRISIKSLKQQFPWNLILERDNVKYRAFSLPNKLGSFLESTLCSSSPPSWECSREKQQCTLNYTPTLMSMFNHNHRIFKCLFARSTVLKEFLWVSFLVMLERKSAHEKMLFLWRPSRLLYGPLDCQ